MKKRLFLILLCYVLMLSLGAFAGCKKSDEAPPKEKVPDYNPYPTFQMNAEKHLTVIDQRTLDAQFNFGENYIAVQALQGMTAKSEEGVQIYILENDNQKIWLDDLVVNYGYTYESVKSVTELVLKYKSYIKDNGFITYKKSPLPTDNSSNLAIDLCIATGYLPVAEALEQTAVNEWGLTKKMDIYEPTEDGETITQEWIFDTYRDKFSRDILFHYDPSREPLRDYAVATNGFMFYTNINDEDKTFLTEVYEWAKPNIPVMGWGQDEMKFVGFGSQHNKYTIASDFSENLTVLSAVEMPQPIKQNKLKREVVTPQAGKHYLALCFSDGDNMQWMQNIFLEDSRWFGSEHRGKFPVSWGSSLNSSLLQPSILQLVYNSATEKDEFVAGVNGIGYMDLASYGDTETFVKQTAPNMEKTDTPYMDLITYESTFDPTLAEAFSKIDYAKGFLLMVGDKYSQGRGSIYWANDKPFLSFRDTLWDTANKQIVMKSLAKKIGNYVNDYTKIEGYTLLNVNCWNYGMDDLNTFVELLAEYAPNVELLNAGQLLEMVTEYCPHEKVVLDSQGNRVEQLA